MVAVATAVAAAFVDDDVDDELLPADDGEDIPEVGEDGNVVANVARLSSFRRHADRRYSPSSEDFRRSVEGLDTAEPTTSCYFRISDTETNSVCVCVCASKPGVLYRL